MRSQLSHEEEPPIPSGSVVNLADYEDEALDPDASYGPGDTVPVGDSGTIGGVPAADSGRAATVRSERDTAPGALDLSSEAAIQVMEGPPPQIPVPTIDVDAVDEPAAAAPDQDAEIASSVPPAQRGTAGTEVAVAPDAVAGVAVEELVDGVSVTVRAVSGASATRRGPATREGVDMAVAMAAAAVASPDAAPRIVSISGIAVDGSDIVNVVFEVGAGERRVGAAAVRGGRASAVARATWAAFRG
jgi:hypothetical protein